MPVIFPVSLPINTLAPKEKNSNFEKVHVTST